MSAVRFRSFQRTDVTALQQLMTTTIDTCYSTYPPAYRQHWMDDHHSPTQITREATEGFTIVIECEGRIIGTGNITRDWIQSVLIHPEHQRQGLGTALIRKLEDHARQNQLTVLHVTALPPSQSFFERLGYSTLSTHHFKAENLHQFIYYRMEKRL